MKTTLVFVLITILGVATGTSVARWRLATAPWDGNPGGKGDNPILPEMGQPGDPVPKVVVDSQQHDFGVMDMDGVGRHGFRFTNAGEAVLELEPGPTTCQCTGIKIEKNRLSPGESTEVTVTWTSREVAGPYSQNGVVFCNDPHRPRVTLTIQGRVKKAVEAVPPEVVFSRLSVSEPTTAEVALYGYLAEPLEILDFVLSDRQIADKFEVSWGPMPPDRLAQDPEATSGRLLTVTIKPGLPLGQFQQTILLRTSLESAPAIDVPLRGTVGSDIAVFGHGWDEDIGTLTIGAVRGDEGARRQLTLVARGPHRREVQYKLDKVFPDTLHVSLGKTTETGDGTVLQTPLIIEIPKGSLPVNHLTMDPKKSGQIILETNHPSVPRLQILVRFAVTGAISDESPAEPPR